MEERASQGQFVCFSGLKYALIGLLLSVLSFSAYGAGLDCERALGIDDRFLQSRERYEIDESIDYFQHIKDVTRLLGEAFQPVLETLAETVKSTPLNERGYDIKLIAKNLKHKPLSSEKLEDIQHDLKNDKFIRRYGFDGAYTYNIGLWKQPLGLNYVLDDDEDFMNAGVGFLDTNEKIMKAAIIAMNFVYTDVRDMDLNESMESSAWLRRRSTFYDAPISIFSDSLHSLLLVLSQFTVNSFEGLSDIELVEKLLLPQAHSPVSLINAAAILYAPAVIGPHGQMYFMEDPIVYKEGKLQLTDTYKKKLKERKKAMPECTTMETGNGCPVAHRNGNEKSGLDHLNEAFFYLFRQVYKELYE